MALRSRKVAIVGAGLVGSSTAISLVTQGGCDELVLIDINKEKALGEVLDLRHCVEYLNKNISIKVGDYEDCSDIDIVVITAGAAPKPGQSKIEALELSTKIVESIVNPIMKSGFNGHFIIISNPVDVISYHVYKTSGLPRNRVIGTGTALDSARLKTIIGEIINVDPKVIQAYSMGEYGDSQMIPWSNVYIAGIPFKKIIEDNESKLGYVNLDKIRHDTIKSGWEIFKRKGTTYYGIAASCVGIIRSIINNENRIMPVSTLLDGEYGEYGIFSSVPSIINKEGVKAVVEIDMTEDELIKFKESNQRIRDNINKL